MALRAPEDRIDRVLQDLRPEPFPGRETRGRALAERMADCATPAVSIAVIEDCGLAWARGFGARAAGTPDDVTASTPFQAGSISKPVFALAVMRLVEDGVLDLDADVNDALTSWRVPANDGWQPRITLRQLLSHTAGTTVHGFPGYPAAGPWPTVPEVLQGAPPANTMPVVVDLLPGTQFRYSGGGTTIAQQIVVDVTGRPFPELMRALVLDPLAMADSTFEQPLPAPLAARAARAHPWNGVQTRGGWHVYPEMAAAGLWTTAQDLARVGAAVMRTLRGERSPLGLRPETLAQMLHPQLPDQKPGEDFVGLGWFCSGKDGDLRFGHTGADEGFLAELRLFPALGHGAVVMINSIQGWGMRNELLAAIGREYRLPAAPAHPTAVAMPTGVDYSGLYRSKDGMALEVIHAADGLILKAEQQAPLPLTPASERAFFATALGLRVTFDHPDAGSSAAMSVIQGGKTIALSRAT